MRIAIMGAGRMGSWFARELCREHEVAVYDMNKDRMKAQKKVIHLETVSAISEFIPELLINAVSLHNTIDAFRQIAQYLTSKCIISDIATIKGNLQRYYGRCNFKYASLHPMFGPRFADLGNVAGENVIIIKESDEHAKHFFNDFFLSHGLDVFECSFSEHDKLMAHALTLPFSSSLIFASCMAEKTVPGTTFKRHREIAGRLLEEDDYLLAEVLFNPSSLSQMKRMKSSLASLEQLMKAKEYEKARKYFNALRKNLRYSSEEERRIGSRRMNPTPKSL